VPPFLASDVLGSEDVLFVGTGGAVTRLVSWWSTPTRSLTPRRGSGTERSVGVPSGSSAGVPTALCRAYTPGPGRFCGSPDCTRIDASSAWVSRRA